MRQCVKTQEFYQSFEPCSSLLQLTFPQIPFQPYGLEKMKNQPVGQQASLLVQRRIDIDRQILQPLLDLASLARL